jgi:hypothetical protein
LVVEKQLHFVEKAFTFVEKAIFFVEKNLLCRKALSFCRKAAPFCRKAFIFVEKAIFFVEKKLAFEKRGNGAFNNQKRRLQNSFLEFLSRLFKCPRLTPSMFLNFLLHFLVMKFLFIKK